MVTASLAATPLSINEVFCLANVFESTFNYLLKHDVSLYEQYFKEVKTFVGLGLTVALAEGNVRATYHPSFALFFKYGLILKEHPRVLPLVSTVLAEMVMTATSLFQSQNHPFYYGSFVHAVKQALNNTAVREIGKTEEAMKLLEYLFGRAVVFSLSLN